MASQTTQLIVELLDRVSGPARGVSNSLRGITRTVKDATSAARSPWPTGSMPPSPGTTGPSMPRAGGCSMPSAPSTCSRRAHRARAGGPGIRPGAGGTGRQGQSHRGADDGHRGCCKGDILADEPVRHRHRPRAGLPRRHGPRCRPGDEGHAVDRTGRDRHGSQPRGPLEGGLRRHVEPRSCGRGPRQVVRHHGGGRQGGRLRAAATWRSICPRSRHSPAPRA